MKKFVLIVGIFLIITLSFSACHFKDQQDTVSDALGIDISGGSEISRYDTHSGNGDGTSCIAFKFTEDQVLGQIQENPAWNAFPLDQTVETLVYGISEEAASVGPFLTDAEGNALVPEIQDGYYLLIDRQPEEYQALGEGLLDRGSFNLTVGIYDVNTNILYFCQLDT